MPVEVEPSSLGTLNSECGPYEVSVERERKLVAVESLGDDVPATDSATHPTDRIARPHVRQPDPATVGRFEIVARPHHHDAVLVMRTRPRPEHRRLPVTSLVTSITFAPESTANAIASEESIRPIDRFVARLHHQHRAVLANPGAREIVVGIGDSLHRLAIRMSIGTLIGLRIVGIAMEIPSGNIIDEAVVIVVLAVTERDDQILGGDPARLGMQKRTMHARIVRVVIDSQRAVTVEVVTFFSLTGIPAICRAS